MKRFLIKAALLLLPAITSFSQASFSGEPGIYGKMLDDLKASLTRGGYKTTVLDGKERTVFVSWIRDHVHTMKAHKYWAKDLSSYLEFFMGRQSPKGMYYDYVMSYRQRNVTEMFFANVFDPQFFFIDVNNQNWFFRMPIEADLEYLVVEGVYTYWQSSGDTAFLRKYLPVMVKGMGYEMSDPLRWSSKYLLVKRPYSIDTWDFTSEPAGLTGVDRLLYHIGNTEKTPKGIMHGDNTGMYQACKQLSEMFAAIGMKNNALEWNLQGELLLARVNTLCWNGKYYSHFVPEDPLPGHLKTDPLAAIGLSNTYSINRGAATRSMAASIISRYIAIGDEMKDISMAPWYGIYPFVEPDFGKYAVGTYMNGAILPLVGGELTKAAFENGFEKYAVQQLEVLDRMLRKNAGVLPGCMNFDGTPQAEAVPSVWGQAAFVSALVEGLAGVVDKGVKFDNLLISPRWIFAGVDRVSVNVGYGGDGNQVKYDYKYSPAQMKAEMTIYPHSGTTTVRMPFPEKALTTSVTVNGKSSKSGIDNVNGSKYSVVRCSGSKTNVTFNFR